MKRPIMLIAIGASLILSQCKIADLRPKAFIKSDQQSDWLEKGRSNLNHTAIIYGLEKWKTLQKGEAVLKDDWPNKFWEKLSNPLPKYASKLDLKWTLGKSDANLKVLESQCCESYSLNDPNVKKKQKDYIKNIQYWFEFPFRIMEATHISYAGTKKIDDKNFSLYLASWKMLEPQKDIDQYLIYLNDSTGYIEHVDFTFREVHKSVKGTVSFSGYKKIKGLIIPTRVEFQFNSIAPVTKPTHYYNVEKIDFS